MKLDVNTGSGYDIAVALGGHGTMTFPLLKWLITGSIRTACGVTSSLCVVRHGEVGNNLSTFTRGQVLVEVQRLRHRLPNDRTLRDVMYHWLAHAVRAMNYLPPLRGSWLCGFAVALRKGIYNPHQDELWEAVETLLQQEEK